MKKIAIWVIMLMTVFNQKQIYAQSKKVNKMNKKILFVLTSHGQKGNTGQPTGYYLTEAAHPHAVFTQAGYEIEFVSPKGGQPPVDGLNLNDETLKSFWENADIQKQLKNTLKPEQVKTENFQAIFYVGGHGTMWDFADNQALASIATKIYENGGVVAAVCHGPAGLVNIKLSDGKYLVDGKKINAFTDEEEIAVKLEKVVPFMLETKLRERGAIFEKSGLWQPHVAVDSRVVTGQNPASAKGVAEAVLKELEKINQ